LIVTLDPTGPAGPPVDVVWMPTKPVIDIVGLNCALLVCCPASR
jgi:hypothetical protein